MASQFSTSVIFKEAREHVVSYAFFRPESAIIIGTTFLGITLCLTGVLPSNYWWGVLLAGICAEAVIIFSTLHDDKFLSSIAATKFYARYNADNLGIPELRSHASTALACHRQIFTSIKAYPDAPLGDVAHKTDEWIGRIYRVAHSLDTFAADPAVIERLRLLNEGVDAAPVTGSQSLSLILADNNNDAAGQTEIGLLGTVKQVVQSATEELDASLRGMGHVQHQLSNTHPASMDWSFAQSLTVVISNHMLRLDDAGDLVDGLFAVYAPHQQAASQIPSI
jgi:hypothetical protein